MPDPDPSPSPSAEMIPPPGYAEWSALSDALSRGVEPAELRRLLAALDAVPPDSDTTEQSYPPGAFV